jgi:hypothetical protein
MMHTKIAVSGESYLSIVRGKLSYLSKLAPTHVVVVRLQRELLLPQAFTQTGSFLRFGFLGLRAVCRASLLISATFRTSVRRRVGARGSVLRWPRGGDVFESRDMTPLTEIVQKGGRTIPILPKCCNPDTRPPPESCQEGNRMNPAMLDSRLIVRTICFAS